MNIHTSAGALNELKEVIQKVVPLIVGKGIRVTQRGSQAFVQIDPKTRKPEFVNIPNVSDNASPDFIAALNGFIDHECAHILFSDFDVYGGSLDRAAETGGLLPMLHNIVEDTMIERLMVEQFPGSAKNLSELRKRYLLNITAQALKTTSSPEEAFRCLAVPMVRALAGNSEMRDFMDAGKHWDNPVVKYIMDTLSKKSMQLIAKARDSKQTLAVAEELYKLLKPNEPKPPQESDEEGEGSGASSPAPKGAEGKKGKGEKGEADSEASAGGGSKDEDGEEESDGKGSSGGAPSDGEEEGEAEGDENDDADEDSSDAAEGDAEDEDESDGDGDSEDPSDGEKGATGGSPSKSNFFDADNSGERDTDNTGVGSGASSETMFDFDENSLDGVDFSETLANEIEKEAVEMMNASDYNVYTTEFDQIEPPKVPSDYREKESARDMSAMDEQTSQMTGRMSKDIERVMASRSYNIRIPGYRKGKLHTSSLHRVVQGDMRVFTQKQEKVSTETAVSLLIDNSGSMGGAKMRLAMLSGYALSRTLDRLKIAHEVLGFTTGGWGGHRIPQDVLQAMYEEARTSGIQYDRDFPLAMPIYKSFAERLDTTVKERIAFAMNKQKGLNGNIDGECVRIAANRLHQRMEKRKVMLVLSDGWPAGSSRSGPHLKTTVEQVTKEGIDCVGIGIMDKSVSAYYPNHTVLNNIEDLPGQVMNELKKILL
ncbi:cobalamin biosynthesis protein CobT [Ochrobactrum sp. P20RRXII]|nr:hypothetical protein [Ochrobactrum sp. P20RRXII]NIH77458.1 cobalamin biosynthesis protein CobT [Ochrobactrum sp. P20RRXII]